MIRKLYSRHSDESKSPSIEHTILEASWGPVGHRQAREEHPGERGAHLPSHRLSLYVPYTVLLTLCQFDVDLLERDLVYIGEIFLGTRNLKSEALDF